MKGRDSRKIHVERPHRLQRSVDDHFLLGAKGRSHVAGNSPTMWALSAGARPPFLTTSRKPKKTNEIAVFPWQTANPPQCLTIAPGRPKISRNEEIQPTHRTDYLALLRPRKGSAAALWRCAGMTK